MAVDAEDLHAKLALGGHLLPLPKEPAALANVLEVSIVDALLKATAETDGLEARRGSERGYPDLEFSGAALNGRYHAVDVKVARRRRGGRYTESRITLYTANTYFLHPNLHWPGTFRPFDDYLSHLDLLVLYTLDPDSISRAHDLELIVQESWSIASRQRSSTTREYIGAVDRIEDLRAGKGAFGTQAEFYRYWRAFGFRLSIQVQRQLTRLVRQQQAEIETLRAQRDNARPADQ